MNNLELKQMESISGGGLSPLTCYKAGLGVLLSPPGFWQIYNLSIAYLCWESDD